MWNFGLIWSVSERDPTTSTALATPFSYRVPPFSRTWGGSVRSLVYIYRSVFLTGTLHDKHLTMRGGSVLPFPSILLGRVLLLRYRCHASPRSLPSNEGKPTSRLGVHPCLGLSVSGLRVASNLLLAYTSTPLTPVSFLPALLSVR